MMKKNYLRVNAAATKNAASGIGVLRLKVRVRTTGEIKQVDTAEYLMNMSSYEIMEG